MTGCALSMALGYGTVIYIILIVEERQQKLKLISILNYESSRYALNVMGCRSLPYWIGTFIFDYLFYVV